MKHVYSNKTEKIFSPRVIGGKREGNRGKQDSSNKYQVLDIQQYKSKGRRRSSIQIGLADAYETTVDPTGRRRSTVQFELPDAYQTTLGPMGRRKSVARYELSDGHEPTRDPKAAMLKAKYQSKRKQSELFREYFLKKADPTKLGNENIPI